MGDDIVFYHNPRSRGRIVHWMLEEVGVPYTMKGVDFEAGEHRSPAFLKLNSMGKIPVIVHGGTVVTETPAICAYLADAFPEAQLAPAIGTRERGTYYRWLFFGAGCVEPAMIDRMFDRPLPAQTSALGYGSYESTLAALEAALEPGPFLLGDRFSAADVYVASQIGWGMMTKSIESRPSFIAYVGRCSERPAAARAAERDKALAAKS